MGQWLLLAARLLLVLVLGWVLGWEWGLDDVPVGVLLLLLFAAAAVVVVVVPKRRGKRRVSGCLRMGRQALMMPRLASRRVQTPRSTKW